jgi:tripartite-type tricarboxylate transporter receptor subunit TctC
MWRPNSLSVLAATLLGLAANVSTALRGQEWPAKPVKIVAPFAPGGTSDELARILADHFGVAYRQTFYVESRPGAGGMIGSAAVAMAEPDGYTLIISGIASHVIAPAFNPNPPYDGLRDFTHIAYLGGPPVGLLVHPSLGLNSYREFLAFAKASSSVLDYTSSGAGTHGFLFGDELARKEHIRLNHIPYKGGGPAMMDLVAGHVRIATLTFSSAAEQIRAGTVRALAVSSEQRLAHFPDIPTFRELGYDDMISTTWFALSGPAHLPAAIVDSLNRETAKALQQADAHQRLMRDEIELKPMTPDEVTRFIASEIARWSPAAKAAAAKGDTP